MGNDIPDSKAEAFFLDMLAEMEKNPPANAAHLPHYRIFGFEVVNGKPRPLVEYDYGPAHQGLINCKFNAAYHHAKAAGYQADLIRDHPDHPWALWIREPTREVFVRLDHVWPDELEKTLEEALNV